VYSTNVTQTKTWLTPKRLARGPEAANAEMRRWASNEKWRRELSHVMKQTFRPAQVYGSAADMRRDALASRSRGVGSTMLATDAHRVGPLHVAVAVGALGLGFVIGRWWMQRRRAAQAAQTQIRGDEEDLCSDYERGLDALAAGR
jgi:hypothetical protein